MEWTVAPAAAPRPVNRGGDYYEASLAERVENRNEPEPTYRDPTLGVRLCASFSPGSRP